MVRYTLTYRILPLPAHLRLGPIGGVHQGSEGHGSQEHWHRHPDGQGESLAGRSDENETWIVQARNMVGVL